MQYSSSTHFHLYFLWIDVTINVYFLCICNAVQGRWALCVFVNLKKESTWTSRRNISQHVCSCVLAFISLYRADNTVLKCRMVVFRSAWLIVSCSPLHHDAAWWVQFFFHVLMYFRLKQEVWVGHVKEPQSQTFVTL